MNPFYRRLLKLSIVLLTFTVFPFTLTHTFGNFLGINDNDHLVKYYLVGLIFVFIVIFAVLLLIVLFFIAYATFRWLKTGEFYLGRD